MYHQKVIFDQVQNHARSKSVQLLCLSWVFSLGNLILINICQQAKAFEIRFTIAYVPMSYCNFSHFVSHDTLKSYDNCCVFVVLHHILNFSHHPRKVQNVPFSISQLCMQHQSILMSVYCCKALLSEIQINFVWGYHTCLSHLLHYITNSFPSRASSTSTLQKS